MNAKTAEGRIETFSYDDGIVRKFVIATLIWGVVGMLVGVIIASQLAYWRFNLGLPWTTFGRLRPLHTNAVIFAFAGNAIFAGIYYSTQRLCKARMFNNWLSTIHFWGWQLIIVSAALTLPFGITVGKEYAELELPIKIAIALIWVVFGINYFGTLYKRREKHMYVALWFYMATVVTIALLHIVNSINLPVSFLKSYPVYAGVQDALVQWWYGHNAVAFFLTTPFLGMMYYFLPKAAERPVYSYKLSIVHFWTLVFMYIWAGPHHLLYTALPEWAQTLGMVFSVMLLAPSWGGMINGLLTLRGAWDKVRTEPVLKFFVAGVTFYGMSTFEGPLLSIKSVNALAHYTDWIIGHVHSGALGWNGFVTFAMAYWLVPRLWKTELYSKKLATFHFWCGILGIIIYVVSMWSSGITQGLMLRAIDPATGKLAYPDFVETVVKILPLYTVRLIGGTIYFVGVLAGVYNLFATMKQGKAAADEKVSAVSNRNSAGVGEKPHRRLEGLSAVFAVLSFLAVVVGTIIELVPALTTDTFADFETTTLPSLKGKIKPYSPLELHGRDVYVREGCYNCHSQMIRPMQAEALRYGAPSRVEESRYDHPFQWGSRRSGPDLARVGGKYPDLWHVRHMMDPRELTPGSIMPAYPWLFREKIDFSMISRKLSVMKQLGVPYVDQDIAFAEANARGQAKTMAEEILKQGGPADLADKEITALIAYLQRLGADSKK